MSAGVSWGNVPPGKAGLGGEPLHLAGGGAHITWWVRGVHFIGSLLLLLLLLVDSFGDTQSLIWMQEGEAPGFFCC